MMRLIMGGKLTGREDKAGDLAVTYELMREIRRANLPQLLNVYNLDYFRQQKTFSPRFPTEPRGA